MKVIIAGSRDFTCYQSVCDAIMDSGFTITEVVSGKATGVDTLGEKWAAKTGIPVKAFPANWNLHKKAAGPIRNGLMADYADALICIHTGSRGSKDMCSQMRQLGKPVFEVQV